MEELESLKERMYVIKEELSDAERYELINEKLEAGLNKLKIIDAFGYGGEYANLYQHPEYLSKWKGTFYDKERIRIATSLFYTLSIKCYKALCNDLHGIRRVTVLGYCDYATATNDGPVVHLIDPYGEITLPPFTGMPNHLALCYSGKMLLVTLLVREGEFPLIIEIQTLFFTLRKKITKDSPLLDTMTE